MSREGIINIFGFGIRAKFIILISALLSVSTVILSGILIYYTVNSLRDVIKQKGILLAKKIADDSIYGVTIGDATILDGVIREIKNDPDLVYAAILDTQGKALAHTNKKEIGKVFNETSTMRLQDKGETSFEKLLTGKGETVFDIWVPISLKDSKEGSVLVRLSSKRVTEGINKILWIGLDSTMVIIFFGSLLSYLLVGLMIKPIEEMALAAGDIAGWDFTRRLDIPSKDEIGKLATSFNNMLVSLENKDKEIRQNMRDLGILNTTAALVNQSLDLREILDSVLGKTLEITDMDAAWVYILDEKDNLLKVVAHKGVSTDFVEEIDRLVIGEGIAGRVTPSGEPIVIEDISKDERLTRQVVKENGFKGFISIPIRSQEKILGAINITSKRIHESSFKEVNLLKGIGSQIGMAITNSNLYGKLKAKMDELRSTQDQLIQSTKLAAVGELAGHIAHEINNPLTGILGYASLLIETETDPDRKEQLKIIEVEAMRTRGIVKKLLDFARQVEPKRERVNINQIIKVVLSLIIGPAKASNINIVEEYCDELPEILIDVNQIEQVFLNIINNSMDAMPKGGILAIKSYLDGRYAAVSISDNGKGIRPEILSRIFEPFFTIKENVSGAGLGLSVSLGIIERHGGKIDAESSVGKGSRFTVRLPAGEV